MPVRNLLSLAIMLVMLLVSAGNGSADCAAGDLSGYFEGTAKSRQAGELTISMNLRCVNGQYGGELTTPLGAFPLEGGRFDAGLLRLQFEAGGDPVMIEARFDSGMLRGTFRSGDDTGPIALRRVGDPKPSTLKESTLNLSTEQWREDLKYFARALSKGHANAFHYVSRERFETEVRKLDERLDRLNGDEVYVEMDRIANLVGDAHTYIRLPGDRADFPLVLRQFDDEYRVALVAPGLERALGARVLKIQDTPIARALEIVSAITPQDETRLLAQARIAGFLTMGLVLHGFGIIPDRSAARYTLADDSGKEFTIEVHALAPEALAQTQWVSPSKDLPLYRQKPEESFWYTYLPEARTVYCNFRGYQNLGQHAAGLLSLVKQQRPDKLVIDLRQNGGGDYTEGLKHLVHPMRDLPNINRKGHLFVLVGPNTFSAAMSNAAHFRFQTAAILVGQPIGEKPNSYQEPRQATLPNSRLILRYSTQFYKFVESGENIIRPDREIVPSWNDFKSGRDPVLEWVLRS